MGNAQIQTVPTTQDVLDFLAGVEDSRQQLESQTLINIMHKVSGEPPVMWGPGIIGFGKYHYKYDSGREGDMPDIAFSPRKGKFTLYITYHAERYEEILKRLGKHKTSKGCIYITKLADVDMKVLEELIATTHKDNEKEHASS